MQNLSQQLNQWLAAVSEQKFALDENDECILLDEQQNHYLNIQAKAPLVVFTYSLALQQHPLDLYKTALILNSNPSLLGRASLALGDDEDGLILTVTGYIENQEQLIQFWQDADELRDIVADCLEAVW